MFPGLGQPEVGCAPGRDVDPENAAAVGLDVGLGERRGYDVKALADGSTLTKE